MYGKTRTTEIFTDHYSLIENIGAGGYGTVWTCLDRVTKEKFAVKIVPDKKCWRKTWCDKFQLRVPDEVSLWLPLQHPNITKLHEVFYDEISRYWAIVMDYDSDFEDLFNYIDRNGPLSSTVSAHITRQVIKVVHYLVSSGIDHRDIKDENILYNPKTRQIKLLDFGSASKMPTEPYNSYQGTDVYLPPEYYIHKKYEALPATVWTIGCLVHCLIAGDCPFTTTEEIRDFVCLRWLDDGDEQAKSFIDSCLKVVPGERLHIANLLRHPWFSEGASDGPASRTRSRSSTAARTVGSISV